MRGCLHGLLATFSFAWLVDCGGCVGDCYSYCIWVVYFMFLMICCLLLSYFGLKVYCADSLLFVGCHKFCEFLVVLFVLFLVVVTWLLPCWVLARRFWFEWRTSICMVLDVLFCFGLVVGLFSRFVRCDLVLLVCLC